MMKPVLVKLGILLGVFVVFASSHIYYEKKADRLQELIVVEQYKMLDSKLFTLSAEERDRALSRNASYADLADLQLQAKSAVTRRDIGFWVSVVFGLLSLGYSLYAFFYCYIFIELIRNEGYKKIAARIRDKTGDGPVEPKDGE